MPSKHSRHANLLAAVEAAILEYQPFLEIREREPVAIIEGMFLLSGPEGPFDQFEVRIEVGSTYPRTEPKVVETGGRLPWKNDRHINPDGTCCFVVWEHWLASTDDTSFAAFLNGPLRQFFLSQRIFETTSKWRFGERPHGTAGMIEAYSEVLDVKAEATAILSRLVLLSKSWPKGHWMCPCGSGKIIRKCHRDKLWSLQKRVPPSLAKQMLRKILISDQYVGAKHKRLDAEIRSIFPSRRRKGG